MGMNGPMTGLPAGVIGGAMGANPLSPSEQNQMGVNLRNNNFMRPSSATAKRKEG